MTYPFRRLAPASAGDAGEIELGHLLGAFGVRGEVRVFLHHRESTLLDVPRDVILVDRLGGRWSARLGIRSGAGKRILGRLDGLDDRDVAATLAGWRVLVPASVLAPLEEGEYYDHQLIGAAVTAGGAAVGRVREIQHTAGPDVLVIEHDGGAAWVPLLRELIVDIDVDARVIALVAGALDE